MYSKIKAPQILIIVSLFVFPLIYLPFVNYPFESSKQLFLEILAGVQVFILFYSLNIRKNIHLKMNLLDYIIITDIVVRWLLLSLSLGYSSNLYYESLMIIFYFFLRINLWDNGYWQNRISGYFTAIISAVIIESLIIICEYIFLGKGVAEICLFKKNLLLNGTIGNVNDVGGYLSACCPYLFWGSHSIKYRWIRIFLLIVLLTAILFTMNRGAWIAILVTVFMYFVSKILNKYQSWNIKSKIILLFTIIIIIIGLFYSIININMKASIGRIVIWKISSEIIKDNLWVGVGPEKFPLKFSEYQEEFYKIKDNLKYINFADSPIQTFNIYIQRLLEYGIIGLFLFLVQVIIQIKFWKSIKCKIIGNKIILMNKICILSNSIILIHSIFNNSLRILPIFMLYLLNMAVISKHYESIKNNKIYSL